MALEAAAGWAQERAAVAQQQLVAADRTEGKAAVLVLVVAKAERLVKADALGLGVAAALMLGKDSSSRTVGCCSTGAGGCYSLDTREGYRSESSGD